MNHTNSLVLVTFLAVYVGTALGRWPGLKIDRTGIAVLGAIVLYATGVVSNAMVLQAIDFPTLIVLFGLMVLSAQFAACGFYDWCSSRIAATDASPPAILALTVAVAGTMSAVLVNDVVVFAMTPMLINGLARRGLDPRPLPAETLYVMAALSTLAGNLLIVSSLANIIVVERAKDVGVTLGFLEHARCGVPIALISLALAIAWFAGRAFIGL